MCLVYGVTWTAPEGVLGQVVLLGEVTTAVTEVCGRSKTAKLGVGDGILRQPVEIGNLHCPPVKTLISILILTNDIGSGRHFLVPGNVWYPHPAAQGKSHTRPVVQGRAIGQAALPDEALNGLAFLMDSFTTSIVEFFYTSSHHDRSEPRRHTIEPYEHYFRNGHFYLKAYCLRWVAPNGREDGKFWANPYRLDYILPNDFVLRGTFVHREKRARMIPIRYRLSSQIVRGGISRYFAEMQVSQPDADGWVEVNASTDNEFEAYRTLLAYGDQCVVLEPASLVDRLRQVAQLLHTFYSPSPSASLPANETE